MARPKLTRPTDAELDILRILWDRGTATARDISDGLIAEGRAVNAHAVSTAIRKMIDRGHVKVADERRPKRFAAVHARDETYQSVLGKLSERVFGNSLRELIQHALGGRKATVQERAELRKIADEMED